MMKAFRASLLVAWCVGSLFVASCQDMGHAPCRESKFLMGTLVTVTVNGDKTAGANSCKAVLNEIARIEDLASFHKPSPLNDINNAAGSAPVQTAPELRRLIALSLSLAKQTNGAFDPTIGAVTRLWNFSGPGEPRVPSPSEIEQALACVGWQNVQIDETNGAVFLPRPGMALDLGGMVKAYALGRARSVLIERGVRSALVDIGGDILALGEKAPGKKWRIGVKDPTQPSAIRGIVELSDQFILTSGDYERFLEQGGKRYHHILDPKTGYPATGVRSVTLVAKDPLATAPAGVFVMGIARGLEFLEQMPGVYGWLIDDRDAVHETKNARGLFKDVTRNE